MRVSSERSSHAASIRYLVKIAWRTIPRCGLVALIFLLSGLYMLFDTCGAWRELWAQQHIPVEIIASVIGEAVTLEELRQIEGIERVSPIRCLDAQLISGEHALTSKVLAVLPDYPSFPIIQGGILWITDAAMVAAVSNAGGLGILPAAACPTKEALIEEIRKIKALPGNLCDQHAGVPFLAT